MEYDRHALHPKALDLPPDRKGRGRKRVIPDIVVHRRGVDEANLLAIEIKKETNRTSRNFDRAKLRGMRDQLRYQAGLLLDLPAGPGAAGRMHNKEWL